MAIGRSQERDGEGSRAIVVAELCRKMWMEQTSGSSMTTLADAPSTARMELTFPLAKSSGSKFNRQPTSVTITPVVSKRSSWGGRLGCWRRISVKMKSDCWKSLLGKPHVWRWPLNWISTESDGVDSTLPTGCDWDDSNDLVSGFIKADGCRNDELRG